MDPSCSVDPNAVLKLLLHSARFPSLPVNGLLLGYWQKSDTLVVKDVVPLFHTSTCMASCMEVALSQVSAYTKQSKDKLTIVGYYEAGVSVRESKPDLSVLAKKMLQLIADTSSCKACALLLDNSKLSDLSDGKAVLPFAVFVTDESKQPKNCGQCLTSPVTKELPQTLRKLLAENKHWQLADFDMHLDDIRKDWLNTDLVLS